MHELILITGSTGLVGGHLLVKLYQGNFKIRALVRSSSKYEQLKLISEYYNVNFEDLKSNIEWVIGDTLDFVGLRELMQGVSEVYHCAAMVSFNEQNRNELLKTNVQGTSNIVDAALENDIKKFCFISSIAALGSEHDNKLINEKSYRDPQKKVSAYNESKYLSELEVWRGISEGLNAVILNPGVVLGPGIPDKGSMLFFKVGSKGMPFYTNATTGYIDVRDIASIAYELMSKNIFGKRFILVSENLDNKTLFDSIAKEFGKRGPIIKANKFLLNTGAFISSIYGLITRNTPQLTKDTIRSAQHPQYFSSKSIIETLSYRFIPINKTVKDTADFIKKHKLLNKKKDK